MKPFNGVHHVTCIASSPQKTYDFYVRLLGMRLIKKTVDQHEISSYHLFFADKDMSSGSCLSFIVRPDAPSKKPGSNAIVRIGLRVKDDDTLTYFKKRLTKHHIETSDITKSFGHRGFDFHDPDGVCIRIMSEQNMPFTSSNDSAPHAILGLGRIDLKVSDHHSMHRWLTKALGYSCVFTDEKTFLYQGRPEKPETWITVTIDHDMSEIVGSGSVHHLALRVRDHDHLQETMDAMTCLGYVHSPLIDRFYYHAVYVRQNNRILFEFATESPGYLVDESLDELGSKLSLPPYLEAFRKKIEAKVMPIDT